MDRCRSGLIVEQAADLDVQCACDLFDHENGYVALTLLDPRKVSPVKPRFMCQGFKGQALLLTQSFYLQTEAQANIHACKCEDTHYRGQPTIVIMARDYPI